LQVVEVETKPLGVQMLLLYVELRGIVAKGYGGRPAFFARLGVGWLNQDRLMTAKATTSSSQPRNFFPASAPPLLAFWGLM